MEAQFFLSRFAGQVPCQELLSKIISENGKTTLLRGLAGSAKNLAVAAAAAGKNNKHLVILGDRDAASYCYNDLSLLYKPERVFFFPSSFRRSIVYGQPEVSNLVQRTAALNALLTFGEKTSESIVVITYPEALAELIASRETVQKNALHIHAGEKISLDFLRETLFEYHFERVDFVTEPGQFAVRGGIVDVFSFADNRPVRIDFFGDEVESIRAFNVDTQLSEENMTQVEIISNLQDNTPGNACSLFEFAGVDTLLWADEPDYLLGTVDTMAQHENAQGKVISKAEIERAFRSHPLYLLSPLQHTTPDTTITFNTTPQPTFNKNFELLATDIAERSNIGYTTYIFTENPAQVERLKNIFQSIGKSDIRFDFALLALHEGFIDHNLRWCCYTDHQLFERYHRVQLRRTVEKSERLTIQELNSLQVGDYIVHIDHGVGVFGGLVKVNTNGKIQEAVKLIYRDNDVLMVNIHGLHRISKYKSKDAETPKIHKLGSGVWQQQKQTTKRKVKDIARELIALYAKRKQTKGYAFSADSYMQYELEASFIYEDTPDQMKATQALKLDMEQEHPMDRLICGDVGFGKTEVAIRAAFKAAADGKQVAVLVPTTILALQHFKTFSARLAEFPVKVDYICRLRSAKQIKEILQQLTEGKVDIIIGTHRLLNKDVKFKDLGLLIVDEEQKFGVAAKEKLRHLKLNVDTLTMTATPIPRTLQFSLMGARDLSIINTPPPNRHPIVTEVHTFHEEIVRDAIRYEVERGGQVFFVHNRVQDIHAVEDIIRRLCPGVKTGIGHGQMPPEELEKVILGFMSGDFDVLICTTIVENGLDIPNANTIIINQAQHFGLSDLHQLRGRVGRSNRKAFCYLLAPPPVSLTDDARRRLKAIETFSELGSGFNIAMQDLDIRGAGNLLGGEQSGFIADIGFEMYQKILNEALQELKEEEFTADSEQLAVGSKPAAGTGKGSGNDTARSLPAADYVLADCSIDTDMEILIPDDYVDNVAEKMRLYKELDNLTDEEGVQNFLLSLTDRFGPPPPPVEELCNIVRLRRLAMSLGFEKIVLKNKLMIAYFIGNQLSPYYKSAVFAHLLQYIQSHPREFSVKEQHERLYVTVKHITSVQQALNFLQQMKSY